jgi:D-alanyl-D-alanine carboxypeptidase/D-alanyl-D-alanine-endopeptidase (penicillin-binding protein 4)
MPRRAHLILAILLALAFQYLAPASLAQGSGSVSLTLSALNLGYGHRLHATGTVQADAPCAGGRTVDLQLKPVGTTVWTLAGSRTSAGDGSFDFALTPHRNAAYRAVATAAVVGATTCEHLASPFATGVVAAAVGFALSSPRVAAGNCVRGVITVQPNKSGQHVRLQRLGSSGWRTISTLTLDGSSRAVAKLCKTWSAVGTRSVLRATWPVQDATTAAGASAPSTLSVIKAYWMKKIDRMTAGRAAGVSIRSGGRVLYARAATAPFAPASNEKLLLSMALLDRLGPTFTIKTDAATARVRRGVVRGNLWILGHGDPSTDKHDIGVLARRIASAGVHKVRGRVMGSTAYFARDWFAPGWRRDFPATEVGLPSALTFLENRVRGRNVHRPERYAAVSLTRRLKRLGVPVRGRPGAGTPPSGLRVLASVSSPSLAGMMGHMDRLSDNFFAEVLGKRLAVAAYGPPGTIARGASVIGAWTRAHGVRIRAYDSSGLSYDDRVTPAGVTTLLQYAGGTPWGPRLRSLLPAPGQGTLEHRLGGVRVRAKTGTLVNRSALSGWVWLSRRGTWGQFSVLDRGMGSWVAKPMEDAIVRTVARYAH